MQKRSPLLERRTIAEVLSMNGRAKLSKAALKDRISKGLQILKSMAHREEWTLPLSSCVVERGPKSTPIHGWASQKVSSDGWAPAASETGVDRDHARKCGTSYNRRRNHL